MLEADPAAQTATAPAVDAAAQTADQGAPITEDQAGRVAALGAEIGHEIDRVLEGKARAVRLAVTVLLADGHLLLEDVPGVGKTLLAKALAAALGARRSRIQFTPDLLPGDITGASIYDQSTGSFTFRRGAVFTHILLADEINRASPKTQSALLESMEERQVSVDGTTYELDSPFMVIATANPVEMEGTYHLPEAQRDRFLAQISLGYPGHEAELRMLAAQTAPLPQDHREPVQQIRARTSPAEVAQLIRLTRRVHASPALLDYIVRLAAATRGHGQVVLGASPRAAVHLVRMLKAAAALDGRTYVVPEDVRQLIGPVWRHRLHLSPQALSRGVSAADVLRDVLASTPLNR
ncbi:AAA family ATPase [Brachybacterium hainanense]|uniref:AAA family ATPase n=1 Tax=Brachybacterium hainanense TaxID=1541174 RepID=A0ABV6RFE0_9MICO